MKAYNQQIKKLNLNTENKKDVIELQKKNQILGYVDNLENLTPEQQEMLRSNKVQISIPWRAVWNKNSVSTPCRVVFDASQPTASEWSLNDILARGKDNINNAVEILIRWSVRRVEFHTDKKKIHNSVILREEDWWLQRYIWQNDLNPRKLPEEKVFIVLNLVGIKQRKSFKKLPNYQLKNTLKPTKLLRMTSM